MNEIGKIFICVGAVIIITGLVFLLIGKIPNAGKLPGDIVIKKENFSFYFPVTTCLLVSIVLSLISLLWFRK